MKKLILIAGLLFGLNATAQEFTLIEINAKWNTKNNLTFTSVDGVQV